MATPITCATSAYDQPEVMELESVCLNCYKAGMTRLLITRIPFLREVVISSFSCQHCGFENRLVDPAAAIQDLGQKITLRIENVGDLNRRMVRPSGSVISIPELDASFPSSQGDLSTIEGVLCNIMETIGALQPERKKVQPELATKLDDFVDKMRTLLLVKQPFTLILDDPSGNGCIENCLAPADDPQLTVSHYKRTKEQDTALGFATASEEEEKVNPEPTVQEEPDATSFKDEVLTFKVNCSNCAAPCDTHMKMLNIPHFKEVVIMATNCPNCGNRDNEVKAGGGIAPKGRVHRLKLTHLSDLSRDLLVSETAGIRIPQIDLESASGTLGGRFTTVEGFLVAMKEQLTRANPFLFGDSASEEEQESKLHRVIKQLDEIITGSRLDVTFELKDPAGNSYLQNLYAPDDDPHMEVIDYERTREENDFLGLLDMNTADFEVVPKDDKSSNPVPTLDNIPS